jgi:hypothetical protein
MLLSPRASQAAAALVKEVSGVREERKVFSLVLRTLARFFDAKTGAVFLHRRSADRLFKVKSLAEGEPWDPEILLAFYRNEKPQLEPDTIMAPVRAGRRIIGVLALGKDGPFPEGAGKEATEMLKVTGAWVGLRRLLAKREAECAISGAILGGLNPKDAAYRVFHQLRRFIDYDHGALLVRKLDESRGEIAARQVAWTKGKSDIVGSAVELGWEALPEPPVVILNRDTSRLWRDLSRIREEAAPPIESMVVASLAGREVCSGLVQISSGRSGFFAESDVRMLSGFLPMLAWCLAGFAANAGAQNE